MQISSFKRFRFEASVVGILGALFIAVLTLFVTAPTHDDAFWPDAPGHATNGALLYDYFRASSFTSPLKFATDYYLHYPALTISVYPPLFPVIEALVFSIAGVSHFAAQLTISLFCLVLAYSVYSTARTAFPPVAAGAAALVGLSTPVVVLWSRQVMLEVPCLALLVAATALFLRFLENRAPKWLYLSVLLFCGAVYTKQTAAFAGIVFAITLLLDQGWPALRQRSVWLAAGLGLLILAPLGAFTVVFASHNFDIVKGSGLELGSAFAISSMLWYARMLPELTGPAPIAAALGYLALVSWKGWTSAQERRLAVLMTVWFAVDYLFISSIAYREDRYGIFLTVPIALLATAFVLRVLPRLMATVVAFAAGALAFVLAIVSEPVPRVGGYDAIASFVVSHAEKNSVVLFHGFRSPNFVFAVRAQSGSPDLYLLRSEKMLVDYKVSRGWGISDRGLSGADIEQLIDRYGIVYVVFQPDFWTDLPSMAALQDLVYSDRFTKVAEFPIAANVPNREKKLVVFRNNQPTHPLHPAIELNMPMLNGRISGKY